MSRNAKILIILLIIYGITFGVMALNDWKSTYRYAHMKFIRDDLQYNLTEIDERFEEITLIAVGYYRVSGDVIVLLGFGGGSIYEEFIPLVEYGWYPLILNNTHYNITFIPRFIDTKKIAERLGISEVKLTFYWEENGSLKNTTIFKYLPHQLLNMTNISVIIPRFRSFYGIQLIVKNIEENSIVVVRGAMLYNDDMEKFSNEVQKLLEEKERISMKLEELRKYDKEMTFACTLIVLLIIAQIFLIFWWGEVGYVICEEYYFESRGLVALGMAIFTWVLPPYIALVSNILSLIFYLVFILFYAAILKGLYG